MLSDLKIILFEKPYKSNHEFRQNSLREKDTHVSCINVYNILHL